MINPESITKAKLSINKIVVILKAIQVEDNENEVDLIQDYLVEIMRILNTGG